MKSVFAQQEKFPFVEEKLQTLKGTEELGFQAVVMPFNLESYIFCVLYKLGLSEIPVNTE